MNRDLTRYQGRTNMFRVLVPPAAGAQLDPFGALRPLEGVWDGAATD
jgi:hypothetical protein